MNVEQIMNTVMLHIQSYELKGKYTTGGNKSAMPTSNGVGGQDMV